MRYQHLNIENQGKKSQQILAKMSLKHSSTFYNNNNDISDKTDITVSRI